ncbi:hypothetical protein HYW53_01885 [Candidatus Giovannonibacteria bacterium]|nr:hypothetical protein [Candidatus Giovannonibacteria bacterium]
MIDSINQKKIGALDIKNILLLVIILIIGVFLYTNFSLKPDLKPDFQQALSQAAELRDIDSKKAAEKFEIALALAKTPEQKAIAKLFIANNYLDVEPAKGMKLLKEIVADNSMPSMQRAFAIQFIADKYMLGLHSTKFARENIFNDSPFDSFILPGNDKDTDAANIILKDRVGIRKIYEFATDTFPIPVANFWVAEWHARRVLMSNEYSNLPLVEERVEYIKKTKEYIEKGDLALPAFILHEGENSQVAYAYWVKGLALGYLYELEKKSELQIEAEESFTKALQILKSGSTDYMKLQSLWASFYYADFLATSFGVDKKLEVKKSLSYIMEPRFFNDFVFLKYLRVVKDDKDSYTRKRIMRLTEQNVEFKDFLIRLGWEFN